MCEQAIAWPEVSFGPPFDCPHCGVELSVSLFYRTILSFGSLALAGVLLYVLGAQELMFLFGVLLVFFPLMTAMVIVAKRIRPPRLNPTGRVSLRDVRRP